MKIMSTRCVKIGETCSLESVRGKPYYVTVDRLPCATGENGGCSVEFRSCVRIKVRRTSLALVTLAFLDLVASFLLVRLSFRQRNLLIVNSLYFAVQVKYNVFVIQCVFLFFLLLYLIFSLVLSTYKGNLPIRTRQPYFGVKCTCSLTHTNTHTHTHRGSSYHSGAWCTDQLHQLVGLHIQRIPAPHNYQ